MGANLSITRYVRHGVRVIMVEGDIDMSESASLDAALDASMDGLPVVVDLTSVVFLDSAGLHALLRERAGSRLAGIVRTQASSAGRALDIVDAKKAVPLFDDLASALGRLGSEQTPEPQRRLEPRPLGYAWRLRRARGRG